MNTLPYTVNIENMKKYPTFIPWCAGIPSYWHIF